MPSGIAQEGVPAWIDPPHPENRVRGDKDKKEKRS